jgi:DNA repair protein RadC
VKLTRDAAQAAEILSIDLLDHVIIGDGRFVSLKEQGAM